MDEFNTENKAELVDVNDITCIQLTAGGYTALISPELGSNVLRLHDDENGIEFFRWDPNNTLEDIQNSPQTWGLPTLYLPNRFEDGVLRTSDAVYHLPINEPAPYNNHIHGFLNKREHTEIAHSANEMAAWARTTYVYNEEDPFFEYLPLPFTVTFMFTLSDVGFEYQVSIMNQSNKMLPVSMATHTTIAAPFVEGAKEEDIRVKAPVKERWVLNERCLPTGEVLPLSLYDQNYADGKICPVKRVVDNEMYTGGKLDFNGRPSHGIQITDAASGKGIAYEVSDGYKFWIFWNDRGEKHYFCPEPMSAMINAPALLLPREQTGYTELPSGAIAHFAQRFYTILPDED